MKRVAFAIAVAGLASVAVSGASKAAPIAPLTYAITANGGNVFKHITITTITGTIGIIITIIIDTGIITTGITVE